MIDILKKRVEEVFGSPIRYVKDCNVLSDSVMDRIRESISPATLRRFFGLLATNSKPSRITLDILSRYVGFLGWDDFCKKNAENKEECTSNIAQLWSVIVENAKIVSRSAINRLKSESGIDFDQTVYREFIDERFDTFLKSSCGASAIVAPGGYGKSTLLARWFLKYTANTNSNDAVFFIPSQVLEQYALSEVFPESWFLRLIGLKPNSCFLSKFFKTSSVVPPGQLIVVIDALDELTQQATKQTKVFSGIIELVNRFTGNGHLKIIVSSRHQCWKSFSQMITNTNQWHFVKPEYFTADMANIPPLMREEIQTVFDLTVNKKFTNRLLIYHLPIDLAQVIGYPYLLQLFVNQYSPDKASLLIDEVGIIDEFLKKQVYFAPNAEEKNDILNFIIKKSNYGGTSLPKNEIKEVYSIHQKQLGNYYAAYEELLSYGILQEDVVIDSVGNYTKYVKISNQQIMCELIARSLIKENGNISSGLNSFIFDKLEGNENLPQVVEAIYRLAYKNNMVKALENFFTIEESILRQVFLRRGIAVVLTSDKILQELLVPIYLKEPIARKLLVEENIDINHAVTSFSFMLSTYLDNAVLREEVFFARTFLTFTGFLTMNQNLVKGNFNSGSLLPNVSPELAAAWFSNMVLHEYCFGEGDVMQWVERAYKYFLDFESSSQRVDFIEIFSITLVVLWLFEPLMWFTESQHFDTDKLSLYRKSVLIIDRNYALYKNREQFSPEAIQTVPLLYTTIQSPRNSLTLILGESLRASYYVRNNNSDMSYKCFRNAMELTTLSGMKIIESTLVLQLAKYMEQMSELERADELRVYSDELWNLSGFKQH